MDWESEGCEDLYLCDCDSNVIHHQLFFYVKLLCFVIGDCCLAVIHYTLLKGYSLLIHSKSGSSWSLNSANLFDFPPIPRLRT